MLMIFISLESHSLTLEEIKLLSSPLGKKWIAGIVIFKENLSNENTIDHLKLLLGKIQRINPRLLTAIDEEGGRVQRTQDFTDFIPLQSAHDQGKLYESDKTKGQDNIIKNTEACGKNLYQMFDINFAPCVDIHDNASPIIGKLGRSFNKDPKIIQECSNIILNVYRKYNLIGTLKHFPGHGRTHTDTHHIQQSVDNRDEIAILNDIKVYQEIYQRSQSPLMIMTNHVIYPNLFTSKDSNMPVCYRTIITKKLKEICPSSVIISDCLNMGSLEHYDQINQKTSSTKHNLSQRLINTLNAGHDIAMLTHQPASVMSQLIEYLDLKCQPKPKTLANILEFSSTNRSARLEWKNIHDEQLLERGSHNIKPSTLSV